MKKTEPFPTELSSDSHHFFLREGSKKLIIFFAAQNMKPGKYNFFQMGKEIEENLLFVNDLSNQWYQNGILPFGDTFEESIKVLENWIDFLHIKEVYTLGTSMGGHASILYGIALKANILAFAPEIILKTPYSRSLKKLKANTIIRHRDLREIMSSYDKHITIISGEEDALDLHFASIVSQTKMCNTISIRGVDHYIPTYLTRASYTTKIVRTFYQTGVPDFSNVFEVGDILENKDVCKNIYRAYLFIEKRDFSNAELILNDLLAINSQISLANYLRGKVHSKLGNFNLAINDLSLATILSPSIPLYLFAYSHAIRMSGFEKESLYILNLLLKRFPNFHRAYYAKGVILYKNKQFSKAIKCFDKAYLLDTTNKTYENMRNKCYMRVNNENYI